MVILVDGLELLMLTLPEEMNVQLDGTRAHMMTSGFLEHQVTMVDAIPYYFPLNKYQKVCGMARGYQKGSPDAFTANHIADGLAIT